MFVTGFMWKIIAKGIDMVQEKGRLFETYNIGGHNERQNIEIVKMILDSLKELLPEDIRTSISNDDLITYVEDRKGHDRRYAIAPDKIKAEVGWYPETVFEAGIRRRFGGIWIMRTGCVMSPAVIIRSIM